MAKDTTASGARHEVKAADKTGVTKTHSPDTPFGCAAIWGPREPTHGGDGRIHVCNKHITHRDRHVCKCGSWRARIPRYQNRVAEL